MDYRVVKYGRKFFITFSNAGRKDIVRCSYNKSPRQFKTQEEAERFIDGLKEADWNEVYNH